MSNLLSGLDKQQRKEQHKRIHEEGKIEWMHNSITLLFFCQRLDWRNGAQKHFCSSPPCKAKQVLPLNFSPHFLNCPPCLQGPSLHPDHWEQLHVWRNSSSTTPENSTSSRHLEWDYWSKTRILAQWKMHKMIPGSFSLCPAPLPHTLSAGWRSLSYRNSWRNIMSMTKSKMGSSCMCPESPRMSAGRHWG